MSFKDENQKDTPNSLSQSYTAADTTDILKEAAPAYPASEELYTVEDYHALPDERRVELIDGVIYDMGAPSVTHQMVVLSLCNTIENQIINRKGTCRVFVSPLDVQLDRDDWTMVQPDMFILCDLGKVTNRCIVGAPDFIAEIVSPGTRTKDSTLKLRKYKEAGVREYWLVDPDKENIVVYHFEKREEPVVYGFESEIPIGIYDGEVEVDFEEIKNKLIPNRTANILKEAAPAYPAQEQLYTIEDYYALPDERRVELIDGVIYDMGAPSVTHQSVVGSMYRTIANQIANRKGKCKVFLSPLDVQLDCDDWTMVQPDILILCDLDKATNRCIVGAPDFIAEIVSPGTRTKDSTLKLRKYKEAGVREYWLIDPDKENVVVYHFEKREEPVVYGFESEIPTGIYDGELVVDFEGIKEEFPPL